jgi:hypothetical protein
VVSLLNQNDRNRETGKESYRGRRKEKGEPPLVFLSTIATTLPLRKEYRSIEKRK